MSFEEKLEPVMSRTQAQKVNLNEVWAKLEHASPISLCPKIGVPTQLEFNKFKKK